MQLTINHETTEGEVIDKISLITGERVVLRFSEDSKQWSEFNLPPAKLYRILMSVINVDDKPNRINGHGFRWSDDQNESA